MIGFLKKHKHAIIAGTVGVTIGLVFATTAMGASVVGKIAQARANLTGGAA